MLDPANITNLNSLVERADAYIVISSTWRVLFNMPTLREILGNRGLANPARRVVGRTGKLSPGRDFLPSEEPIQRGMEIEEWLLTHIPRDEMLATPFIILDDDSDFGRLRPYQC